MLEVLAEMEIRIAESDARLIAVYWKVRPLVIVILKYHHQDTVNQSATTSSGSWHSRLLLQISQRLCDCAVLDTTMLLQVDDVVSMMFPVSKNQNEEHNNISHPRNASNNLTNSLVAESCRAFSRGGSLVASGLFEHFEEKGKILEKLREAIGASFAVVADADPTQQNHQMTRHHPSCVVFVDLNFVTANCSKEDCDEDASGHSRKQSLVIAQPNEMTLLEAPLSGECLELGITMASMTGDEEEVTKGVVGKIRESLSRSLL